MSKTIVTLDDILKAHEELEELNNKIIEEQRQTIQLLKEQVVYMKEVINKYILKSPSE